MNEEELIREALRRLNPKFHENDSSWGALERLLTELKRLRRVEAAAWGLTATLGDEADELRNALSQENE